MSLFDVQKQLTFYGAYHSNKVNVAIHLFFVPVLLWTGQAMLATLPTPSFFPSVHYQLNEWLTFDSNWAAFFSTLYLAYYYALEPIAAMLYTPQMVLSLLTASAFAHGGVESAKRAALVHVCSWIAQFYGHGAHEKRAPALLDNLVGAIVLAPFFVHLELLFTAGYRPEFHKQLNNSIGKEIAAVRRAEAEKRRAAEGKKEL